MDERRQSPEAARQLIDRIAEAAGLAAATADDLLGQTDCPHGCRVEADGRCPHGYESAALTLGVV